MKTIAIVLSAGLAIAATLVLSEPAAAQQPSPCAPKDIVLATLAETYHETPVATMLSSAGYAIMILASGDGSTYSMVSVLPSGTACIISVGAYFELAPVSPAGSAG